MAVRLVCRACGKRLKLPDGSGHRRTAKCPRCLQRIDLTAALEAFAYAATPAPAVAKPDEREEDPLPYPAPSDSGGLRPPLATSSAPAKDEPSHATGASLPPLAKPEALSLDDEPALSLDDDPPPAGAQPAGPVPFRVPARVLADSLGQLAGPCFAVLVPHGLFLEHEPARPLLYVPLRCPVQSPARGELAVTLPDGRALALRFESRRAAALAADTRAFLAGERPVPAPAEYRRRWWLVAPALACALALAAGAVALSQRVEPAGENPGASAPGPVEPPPAPPAPPPAPPGTPGVHTPGPPPAAPRPPSHLDLVYRDGVSVLEDGPADVTALALAPDFNTLAVGFADGSTRLWPLDQPTFEPMLPGPKCDGPVTRVQFDSSSRYLFATCTGGVVVAPLGVPPAAPAMIPGAPVAVSPELANERLRFGAVRGNTLQHRYLAETFVKGPPKAKGYARPGKGDEVTPIGIASDPRAPAGATLLAWLPAGKLVAGLPDGTLVTWGATMRPDPPIRDHKAAVRAWAECPETGDFATGDDRGSVGHWPYKAARPAVAPVFAAPVAALAFSPSGELLAATDTTGSLAVWDVVGAKVAHRVKRPVAVKAVAFGPSDDVIILSSGKAVGVWYLPGLVK